jgi:hypothetical protein
MTIIHIQGTKCLVHLREPSSSEHKNKINLLHYVVLYIYIKLNVIKFISEEKYKRTIEEIELALW